MHDCGLVIFPRPGDEYREDFATISGRLREIDAMIRVRVVHESRPDPAATAEFADLPSLVVSFRHRVPLPVAGRTFSCRFVPKPEQLRHYAEAGIRFPRSRMFEWGLELDEASWGPFMVMKPIGIGTMSQGLVHLLPTSLVGRLKPEHFGPKHPIHHGPMLLQAFIDSGVNPAIYRVLTLFGEPLYAMKIVLQQRRPKFSVPLRELLAMKIATNSGPRDRIMVADGDVLAFARRMSEALPDVPLQGLDILKEHATGRLFALESNPGGNTWHFSSKYAEKMRQEMGHGRDILNRQFDALERAAQVLARATRSYAAPSTARAPGAARQG